MKLKHLVLMVSMFSSSVFAKSYNLNTVVNNTHLNKIIEKLIEKFNVGAVDPAYPIGLSGAFELNEENRLVGIQIEHASFRIYKLPFNIGPYSTDLSISANFNNGNCKKVESSTSKINSGSPTWLNSTVNSALNNKRNEVIDIIIDNSGLSLYCNRTAYQIYFY
ncbi:hypothetical protein [Silvanigrella aquatica]|uniref:Uncharacterized protein n=1 Tax=Silvanigrella aquatica TaxID=1915309 RepID=A0A1L4D030_9BACT|nr:hypothetical protein [Silvanigrella aquatica]APJ03555.1 hypothetical protein AXG55_06395 [Silvanigrella aquatica]